MACSACSKRNAIRAAENAAKVMNKIASEDILGGYKYLNNQQIEARLDVYKKRNCSTCTDMANCDYKRYLECMENKVT